MLEGTYEIQKQGEETWSGYVDVKAIIKK